MAQDELRLQIRVADYLIRNYPTVVFHSDFGSGVKLTKFQAIMQKRVNGGRKSYPDMFIAEPVIYEDVAYDEYNQPHEIKEIIKCGLYIELKREGTRLKKRNGEWASDHIAEQAKMLWWLREKGYQAEFAVGYDEAIRIIDEYLGDKL
ncbi:MAG: hypothetical protein Q4E47_01220 [Candidatus Saccharibacteria bacterium]|nr:hypothetical protein [Candidatus Saccharibacteria bacterium]